jgi:putative membrane protein
MYNVSRQVKETTMMTGFGLMGGWGWLGMLSMTLFWVGVLVLIVWGVSRLVPTQPTTVETDALEILKRRNGRGEINQAEFDQAKQTLAG